MSISKTITDLFVTKEKWRTKKYFCKYCLQCFSSERVLIEHKATCLEINGK